MRKIQLTALSVFLIISFSITSSSTLITNAQVQDSWTWISGDNTRDQSPSYGEIGFEAPSNLPGARQGSATWYDESNNCIWLFGGYGYDNDSYTGYLNDIWRYNFSSNQWTWIDGPVLRNYPTINGSQGEFGETYIPSARYLSTCWIDKNGHLWLYGGQDYTGYYKADLWCYNISLNQWAWMDGTHQTEYIGNYGPFRVFDSNYMPPGRMMSSSWVDENDLFYIFGGYVFSGSELSNDLWCYNTSLGQFAWYGGSNTSFQDGNYGTYGIENPSNHPGARAAHVSWYSGGYVYAFGGWGRSWSGATGRLNDLWRYNLTTNLWAWMSGSDSTNSVGSYGNKTEFHSLNDPSARRYAASCVGSEGNLYLFGGDAWLGTSGIINDLWRYDVDINQWAWLSGNNTLEAAGNYGIQGMSSSTNYPGARQRMSIHCDSSGYIWLFGGNGIDSLGGSGHLNDLWIYVPLDLVIIDEFSKISLIPIILLISVPLVLNYIKRKRK
jgi:N-acetylneuraminic acid mutarotase